MFIRISETEKVQPFIINRNRWFHSKETAKTQVSKAIKICILQILQVV